MTKKVMVAMSGGVDSSTTAVLLKQQGYDVVGITMQLFEEDRSLNSQSIEDARRVAKKFNFPHLVENLILPFQKEIIEYFIHEYLQGRTPNPCIRCNQRIKFGLLLNIANKMGCEYFATGHYARIIQERKKYFIAKPRDLSKDQSYFLFDLPPSILPSILFPLGEFTKQKVRALGHSLGIPVADKAESQDICFLKGKDYREFLRSHLTSLNTQGNIRDRKGNILGQHSGYFYYTIGQRRGLGISYKEPLYVIEIDPIHNEVVVGVQKETWITQFYANQPNIFDIQYFDGKKTVEIYPWYRSKKVEGKVLLKDNSLMISLNTPKRGITPGQAVVFYDGERIVGGGWISKISRNN